LHVIDTEGRHGYASLKHLFTGYDAGFYSYLWSKAHAMDMFDAAFRENVLDSVQGRRYRHMVLEKGGSQDEMLTLANFLGRDPKPDAFLHDLNLN
jgi:metallopeptidase MepB